MAEHTALRLALIADGITGRDVDTLVAVLTKLVRGYRRSQRTSVRRMHAAYGRRHGRG